MTTALAPATISRAEHHENAAKGEAAALELWDMIQAPKCPPEEETYHSRFASAQQDRTLHHDKLPQPAEEPEAMLRKRLSEALLAAAPDGTLLNSEMESPTSTLQFPSSSNLQQLPQKGIIQEDMFFEPPLHTYDDDDDALVVQSTCDYYIDNDVMVEEHRASEKKENGTFKAHPPIIQEQREYQDERSTHAPQHTFVVCADTQLGMTASNQSWEKELGYSRKAVKFINQLQPRPSFCCVCGDLTDMEQSFYSDAPESGFTRDECDEIQEQQQEDFKRVWSQVHPDIALVCLCGNHDVGNRPTHTSIQRFNKSFGNDYLSFWVNGTFNLVLNSCLFADPSSALDLYREQLSWMEERLKYAAREGASQIFVFGHHPWFLYHAEEDADELNGICKFPPEWEIPDGGFPDYYFHVPKEYRRQALDLFCRFGVKACFSGHFHQNLVSTTEWGMKMIITAPLSCLFDSTGKGAQDEPDAQGIRVVTVNTETNTFSHTFETLE